MPRALQPFSLPDHAVPALRALLRKGIHPARKLNRARVLLLLDQGFGPTRIAREVGVHPNTVCNVRTRARALGWEAALEEQRRGGRPPEISPTARAQITALACSDPPAGHARWSLRLLADRAVELGFVASVSHEGVRGVLKKTRSSRT